MAKLAAYVAQLVGRPTSFLCLDTNPAPAPTIPAKRVGKTMRSFQDEDGDSTSEALGTSEAIS